MTAAVRATIAGHPFDLSADEVVGAVRGVAAEPIRTHYVVIEGRRYPPKQVIAAVTHLDRSAFISTQARSVLERLGFRVGRVGTPPRTPAPTTSASPQEARLAREAEMLTPYIGLYVAVDEGWTEVISAGDDPRAVARALKAMGRHGAIFRVPSDGGADIGGATW